MKTRTEILLKYTPYLGSADITYKNILKAMSEVEQQTREEMFEFAEWISRHSYEYHFTHNKWCRGFDVYTSQELFNYWKQLKK